MKVAKRPKPRLAKSKGKTGHTPGIGVRPRSTSVDGSNGSLVELLKHGAIANIGLWDKRTQTRIDLLLHDVVDAPPGLDPTDPVALALWRTCVHEAGHAVAQYSLGFGISHVKVTRRPFGAVGYASPRRCDRSAKAAATNEDDFDPILTSKEIMAWLAGRAAVQHLVRHLPPRVRERIGQEEATVDMETILPTVEAWLGSLESHGSCEAGVTTKEMRDEVERLLQEVLAGIIVPHWQAVLALAGILWDKGFVRGGDAEQLVEYTPAKPIRRGRPRRTIGPL